MMKVLMGGKVRPNYTSNSTQTWVQGAPLMLTNVAGVARVDAYDGSQGVVVGLALEHLVVSNAIADARAVMQGHDAALLLDDSIVENDRIATGVTFAVNDPVYARSDGTFDKTAAGTKAYVGVVVKGNALNADFANATTFRFLFQAPRWTLT